MRNLTSHFKILREEQVQELLIDAFSNPEVARDLALAARFKQEVVIKWRRKPGTTGLVPKGVLRKVAPDTLERFRVVSDKKMFKRFRAHLLRLGVPMEEDKRQPEAGPWSPASARRAKPLRRRADHNRSAHGSPRAADVCSLSWESTHSGRFSTDRGSARRSRFAAWAIRIDDCLIGSAAGQRESKQGNRRRFGTRGN